MARRIWQGGSRIEHIVAGFEPFGGRKRNRSWEAVRRLPDRPGLERACLPVDFARLGPAIDALLAGSPRALLLVGEVTGRPFRVEQVALNVADSRGPDNARRAPEREPLVEGAPLALWAPWNARVIAARIESDGNAAVGSWHAGTFACNAALFLGLQRAQGGTAVGFLHVPRNRWPRGPRLGRVVRAIEVALEALDAYFGRQST